MVTQHYRWDFIGLSSYDKPTPETSEKVVDGSTYYEADTSKLYVFYKDTWYEKTATGGGGGSDITVVQTTGDSTTDVMSQNATTSMIYSDPLTRTKVQLGQSSNTAGDYGSVLGSNGQAEGINSVALANSRATFKGQFDVSTVKAAGMGYNGTNLRRITGVYDPVIGTDAATKLYVDSNLPPIKKLTDNYINYDSQSPDNPQNLDSIALWLLDNGFYLYDPNTSTVDNASIYFNGGNTPFTLADEDETWVFIIVSGDADTQKNICIYGSVNLTPSRYVVDPNTGEPM